MRWGLGPWNFSLSMSVKCRDHVLKNPLSRMMKATFKFDQNSSTDFVTLALFSASSSLVLVFVLYFRLSYSGPDSTG